MSDLIKREDAIKAIHNYWKKRLDTLPTKESECGEVYADIQQMDKILEHNKILCNFIEAIPSADRWIPCSERLPEVHEVVLVTFEYDGDMLVGITERSQGGFWISENVVAWQPLSQPWKGADND